MGLEHSPFICVKNVEGKTTVGNPDSIYNNSSKTMLTGKSTIVAVASAKLSCEKFRVVQQLAPRFR